MTNENGVKQLTDMVASFVDHISKKLPDDVVAKLEELASKELPLCQRFSMRLLQRIRSWLFN